MRMLFLLIMVVSLGACSFGGFKPPVEQYHWHLPKEKDPTRTLEEYIQKRRTDMYACGLDPFVGYHTSTKQGLCMEAKGWYYTEGAICDLYESRKQRGPVCGHSVSEGTICSKFDPADDALCTEWRKKRNLPYPSPDKIHR